MPDQSPVIIKKVKKGGHGHHGGSWKVAFADFMTAMMAFFLVMWILGLDQDTRSAIAGYFQDPFNFEKKAAGNRIESLLNSKADEPGEAGAARDLPPEARDREIAELATIQDELAGMAEIDPNLAELADQMEVRMTDEGLIIEFTEGVGSAFFETGSAVMRPQAREIFTRLGQLLAESNRHIVIDGHTDAAQYAPGATYDNWTLSQDRATATYRVLRQAGVSDKDVLAVRGFADRRLKVPSDPKSFANRRVSVLLPFIWKEREVTGSTADLDPSMQARIVENFSIRKSESTN